MLEDLNVIRTEELPSYLHDFKLPVDKNCAFLGYYVTSSSNSLPIFRDNLSVPTSGVKNPVMCVRISDVTEYKI
jgi:hypothetical protein